ncbi:MAG: DNA mismatch repair endonuclease MutL [Sphingomonadaceae bacterium]|nr:DNA mismatch repair endonuclease MutL [Sphingomonadaceae bacterium]
MPIRRLPANLVNQIAAGEVIERPAAALKELIENALDAGATRVCVRVDDGGLGGIAVSDDGCGMDAAELRLAIERHATSKLPDERLDRIATLGFRGEALPSIGSVARLSLTSRARGAEGWRLVIDHGSVAEDRPAAAQPGTEVCVTELFARLPARRKFLRSARSEWAACLDTVRRLALSAPDVAFRLEHDTRVALDLTAPASHSDARSERVAALFGRDFLADCVRVDHVRDGVRLTGFAGLPTFTRASAEWQLLFVNGRCVKDRLLAGALRGAYADLMMHGRHPAAALWIELPAEEVDVNVHPAKTEVRFRQPDAARAALVGGIRRALDAASGRTSLQVHRAAARAFVAPAYDFAAQTAAPAVREEALPFSYAPPRAGEVSAPAPAAPANDPGDYPLGRARAQLHGLWIVAETAGGLILVDSHAAHERIVLERLKAGMAGGGTAAQRLLVPEVVELPEDAAARIEDATGALLPLGLEIERFGPRAVVVRAVPALIAGGDVRALVRDLADELADGYAHALGERIDRVLATIACHHSVRAGRQLSLAEMDALLRAMETTPHSGQCNHGRPTYVLLGLKDIERLFGR